MNEDLRELELTALRAWPAAQERRLGEWLVRRSEGYTKRANAAFVLDREPGLDLAARIDECDALYRERGLPLIVRESSLVAEPALRALMTKRGFWRIDETKVMVLDPLTVGPVLPTQLDLDHWLELYLRFEGGTKGNQRHHRAIVDRIATPICLAVHHDRDEAVAVGLAVADGTWLGLFDIATDPARRRQGYGRALVDGLLAWGGQEGAKRVFLNVMADNAPAIALYERLGFREAYRYWYWVKPG